MRAGRHVVSANKQLLSQHGEELWACAREHGVQLRFEAAVAGVVPVIRVLQESLAGAHVERIHGIVNGTTNYILTEMTRGGLSYADALRQAQDLGYAEADPSDDVSGRDAAAKMAILARLAFDTPVHLDQVRYEGIEHITADDIAYAQELGLGLKLIGTAERVGRRHQRPRASRLPLRGASARRRARAVQRGHGGVRGDHRDHHVRARRGRPADRQRRARRRHLGHDPARQRRPRPRRTLPVVEDVESAFYLHMEVADRPGVLAQIAEVLGLQGASIKSVVQRGLGDNARLVMVLHPLLESRFYAAVRLIGQLGFMRSPPRAIRVIDEEFT